MTAVAEAVDRITAVNTALAAVLDPELGRPITDLGFVRAVSVGADGSVEARLRLPAAFRAPGLARPVVEDARRALASLAWARACTVVLEDPFDSGEVLLRRGHLAAQAALGRRLLQRGWTLRQLADAVVGDLPERLTVTLRRRRTLLGLPADASSPLFLDDKGKAVPAVGLERLVLP